MHYSIAVLPALAALIRAAPQPQAVHAVKEAAGPARITDIAAEASRVMRIMNEQSPRATRDSTVTVTGKPVTVKTTQAPKPKTTKASKPKTTKASKPKTTKASKPKTTKASKPKTAKPVKQVKAKHNKRAVTTTSAATVVRAGTSSSSSSSSSTLTTSTTTTTTTTTTDVNSACAVQPTYQPYYPAGNASDPQAFLKDSTINSVSSNAGTVSGFTWMWSGYMMQTQTRGFLGVYQLSSYNVSTCAAYCNSVPYCNGFNIFYERNPSLQPAAACPNPAPIASIRCTLWDNGIDIYSAVNYGQWRAAFPVVVAGSNGYSRS